MTYAIRITAKEAKAASGSVMTKDGTEYWVTDGEWGPESRHVNPERRDHAPIDALVFEDFADATNFAATWEGHPWYVKPKAFEVVKVEAEHERTFRGWQVTK